MLRVLTVRIFPVSAAMGRRVWVAPLVWAGVFRRSGIAIIVVIFPALSAGCAVAAIARAAGRGGPVD